MNLTITNHKTVPARILVKFNTYYGNNLSIKWDPANPVAALSKYTANEYRLEQTLKPDEKVVYKWTEDYQV